MLIISAKIYKMFPVLDVGLAIQFSQKKWEKIMLHIAKGYFEGIPAHF